MLVQKVCFPGEFFQPCARSTQAVEVCALRIVHVVVPMATTLAHHV